MTPTVATICLSFYTLSWLSFVECKTNVTIDAENFMINGVITYSSSSNKNVKGLLLNSRMIQGVFDDKNESTIQYWIYPDTKKWDPLRNTNEFVGNMSLWYSKGLLSFTVGLQGGGPIIQQQHHGQPWIVSAFDFISGELDQKWTQRLKLILSKADEIGMVPIIQFFYTHQITRYNYNNSAIYASMKSILDWLLAQNDGPSTYLIDVANECTANNYIGTILSCEKNSSAVSSTAGNMSSITIPYIRQYISDHQNKDKIFYIGSSLPGGSIPCQELIKVSDFIDLHSGKNGGDITKKMDIIRGSSVYKENPKPILWTEDQYSNFSSNSNDFSAAIDTHSSWGWLNEGTNNYIDGYQAPPVNWGINTRDKQQFFASVSNYAK